MLPAPTGLLCDLMDAKRGPALATGPVPRLTWIVNHTDSDQAACHLLVASEPDPLARDHADLWDSGRLATDISVNLAYGGDPLAPGQRGYWKVRTFDPEGNASAWSEIAAFDVRPHGDACTVGLYPLVERLNPPADIVRKAPGHDFIAFERATFGTLRLTLTADDDDDGRHVEVHFGEKLAGPHTIDRDPPGTIRHRAADLTLRPGTHTYAVAVPPDRRNTGPQAIAMPDAIGEVVPFRYVELLGAPHEVGPDHVRQTMVHYPFDDEAAAFVCSDDLLNRVWDLCRYTIKATSFCGLYVDGDRERIPYEGDAYINQLCHYCVDREHTMARRTLDHLIAHPTWPADWLLHTPLIAWADYEHTANPDALARHYPNLKLRTLIDLARDDGLISTQSPGAIDELTQALRLPKPIADLVDWPPARFTRGNFGERDGYDMRPINTVINALHYRAVVLMGRIARVLDRPADADHFERHAARVHDSFNAILFDAARGVYLDGEGAHHAALHANLFPLAMGLVPPDRRDGVVAFIKSRGMACSVYAAQYLLEGLFDAGEHDAAIDLMTATHDRSWHNMIAVGSTMTLEAWDWKYKNNLDWNHAWGAAPANILPRWLMGIQPLEPGFRRLVLQPRPGRLEHAACRLPTIRGTVHAAFANTPDKPFSLTCALPANTAARIRIPRLGHDDPAVVVNGRTRNAELQPDAACLDLGPGEHTLTRARSA